MENKPEPADEPTPEIKEAVRISMSMVSFKHAGDASEQEDALGSEKDKAGQAFRATSPMHAYKMGMCRAFA